MDDKTGDRRYRCFHSLTFKAFLHQKSPPTSSTTSVLPWDSAGEGGTGKGIHFDGQVLINSIATAVEVL